jgi:hypothetical protein
MQSLTVYSDTDAKFDIIKPFVRERGFEFLRITRSRQTPIQVLVTEERLKEFKNTLKVNNISYNVTIDDMSKIIQRNAKSQVEKRVPRAPRNSINLDHFSTYAEVCNNVYFSRKYSRLFLFYIKCIITSIYCKFVTIIHLLISYLWYC